MNNKLLIKAISKKANILEDVVEDVIQAMHNVITETLKNGDMVRIAGFGTFSSKKRDARNGKNPKTGESITIPERNVAKFKPSKELKEELNS